MTDNFCYVLIHPLSQTAIVIDPSESGPVLLALEQHPLQPKLKAVLVTHHHHDHVGGIFDLPPVPVWSSVRDVHRVPTARSFSSTSSLHHTFADKETHTWQNLLASNYEVPISNQLIQALAIPGHTEGQMAYLLKDEDNPWQAFVGDTVFSLGCGRCLEGTPEQLYASLQIIKQLPPDTILHFGHEYTKKNAEFWLEHRDHQRARQWLNIDAIENCLKILPRPAPTVATELQNNPFLKIDNVADFIFWRERRNQY